MRRLRPWAAGARRAPRHDSRPRRAGTLHEAAGPLEAWDQIRVWIGAGDESHGTNAQVTCRALATCQACCRWGGSTPLTMFGIGVSSDGPRRRDPLVNQAIPIHECW